jgi:uncharacterized membrane protein YedE/YeeE
MTRVRLTAVALGLAFGFVLAWTQMTDPDQIRRMLLLEDAYFFLVMASSIGVAFAGLRLLRARRFRALLTGQPVAWSTNRAERRHVLGSVLFGGGWGISYSCPGPIAAQLGQGVFWSLCTIAGIGAGVGLYVYRQRRASGASVSAPTAGAVGASR